MKIRSTGEYQPIKSTETKNTNNKNPHTYNSTNEPDTFRYINEETAETKSLITKAIELIKLKLLKEPSTVEAAKKSSEVDAKETADNSSLKEDIKKSFMITTKEMRANYKTAPISEAFEHIGDESYYSGWTKDIIKGGNILLMSYRGGCPTGYVVYHGKKDKILGRQFIIPKIDRGSKKVYGADITTSRHKDYDPTKEKNTTTIEVRYDEDGKISNSTVKLESCE